MLEVEMKFRHDDWSGLLARMTEWAAVADPPRKDTDSYFNAPDRDFAKTDEAVRVRRIGSTIALTYKGPKLDSATKTRTEIELKLSDGASQAVDAVRFLSALGYRPVAVVSKSRQVYRFHRHGFAMELCLDDVGSVGRFVEVEVMAEPEQFEAAKTALQAVATELGLTDQERRSYLRLLLEQGRG